jgi:hypothetical protein
MKELFMEMDKLLPLFAGLFGALLGAGASIITTYIQNNAQNKRERMKIVSQLAMDDFKLSIDRARDCAKAMGKSIGMAPAVCYVHFYLNILDLLEAGELNENTIIKTIKDNKKILDAIEGLREES